MTRSYSENPKEPTQKTHSPIRANKWKQQGYWTTMQISVVFLYASQEQSESEIRKPFSLQEHQKKGVNLTKIV